MDRYVRVFILMFLAISIPDTADCQIGNLGWAKGAKAVETRKDVDYTAARFQVLIEPGIGVMRHTSSQDTSSQGTIFSNSSWVFVDVGIGAIYKAFISDGSPALDLSIFGTVGANALNADPGGIRLLGAVAPEVGVFLGSSEGLSVRPFASFGPGLSLLEDESTVNLVWVLRLGAEIGKRSGRTSAALGLKRIARGSQTTFFGADISESNILGFFSIRYKT